MGFQKQWGITISRNCPYKCVRCCDVSYGLKNLFSLQWAACMNTNILKPINWLTVALSHQEVPHMNNVRAKVTTQCKQNVWSKKKREIKAITQTCEALFCHKVAHRHIYLYIFAVSCSVTLENQWFKLRLRYYHLPFLSTAKQRKYPHCH